MHPQPINLHIQHATIHYTPAMHDLLALTVRGEIGDTAAPIAPAAPATTPPALGALWPGQGGYYVGILPALGERPAVHLIASAQEAERLRWGPGDTDATGATSRHDGRANTRALLAAGGYPAAKWCADHQADELQDFHLPSQAELFMALLYAPQIFNEAGWYWSSTQYSRDIAFAQAVAYGYSGWGGKGSEFRVRPFRWIP